MWNGWVARPSSNGCACDHGGERNGWGLRASEFSPPHGCADRGFLHNLHIPAAVREHGVGHDAKTGDPARSTAKHVLGQSIVTFFHDSWGRFKTHSGLVNPGVP